MKAFGSGQWIDRCHFSFKGPNLILPAMKIIRIFLCSANDEIYGPEDEMCSNPMH